MPIEWPVLLCLLLLAGVAFHLFYPRIEHFFLFYPQSSFDDSPENRRLHCRDIFFSAADGVRLHGWLFPLEGDDPILLFCHGNAGNISHRLDNVRLLLEQGLQVFLFDYRGYGRSEGSPSEEGIYRDGLAAFDHLVAREGMRPEQIVLFGRSLGGAVALEVALKRRPRSLILESAFTSTRDMARTIPLFTLISPLVPAHYDNLRKIPAVTVPKLIVHGEEDELVPFAMGERLHAAAGPPKFFLPLKGAGHNDTYLIGGERYFRTLKTFARESKI